MIMAREPFVFEVVCSDCGMSTVHDVVGGELVCRNCMEFPATEPSDEYVDSVDDGGEKVVVGRRLINVLKRRKNRCEHQMAAVVSVKRVKVCCEAVH